MSRSCDCSLTSMYCLHCPCPAPALQSDLQFDPPVEIHLGADATQSPSSALVVELSGGGWLSGGSVGRITLPIKDIIK